MKQIIFKLIKRFWILSFLYNLRNKIISFLFIGPKKSKIYNYFISNNEYRRFRKAKKLNKKIFFIYDNSVSSPGLADFLNFIYIIRLLIDKNCFAKVVITKTCLNHRWDPLISNQKLDYYLDQQILLFQKFLNYSNVKLLIINTEELPSFLNKINKDYIFFSSFIYSKSRIYNRLFNFINIVYEKTHSLEFLLKNSEFSSNLPAETISQNYLTIGFRYSNLWRKESNNTSDQINRIIDHISLFSRLDIVILSDELGTAKCKEYLAGNKNLSSVKFSKDFSSSFIEDGAILINSRSYFQFKGGGLGSFALFSKVPYLICAELNHELKFSKNSPCAWANYNQIFRNSKDFDFFMKEISKNKTKLFS